MAKKKQVGSGKTSSAMKVEKDYYNNQSAKSGSAKRKIAVNKKASDSIETEMTRRSATTPRTRTHTMMSEPRSPQDKNTFKKQFSAYTNQNKGADAYADGLNGMSNTVETMNRLNKPTPVVGKPNGISKNNIAKKSRQQKAARRSNVKKKIGG